LVGGSLEQLLAFLIAHAPAWIQAERLAHRSVARALTGTEAIALKLFFPAQVLATVRFATVPMIQNPPFYKTLEEAGIGIPLDFRGMTAITFVDTVLISQIAPVPAGDWLPLLFHELVHVLQYQELGLERFVRVYVMGWAAAGGRYLDIPLERDAYELDARFRSAPAQPFDVLGVVRERSAGHAAA